MQQTKSAPRTNRDRTEATRGALLDAARGLFVSKGYGETSTPEVSAAAGTTRGALYHHFADKRDLFRQVLMRENEAVAADIRAAAPSGSTPRDALIAGSDAYLHAMSAPGRTRLLLIEGPAVLGMTEMVAMDEASSAATLREGLTAAGVGVGAEGVSLDALSGLLSAAFDRAALEIDGGADPAQTRDAVLWLLGRVL
ncbi:MAG: TetR/AcrR family transcriptional regulator [Comamonadaceae bacterium]|nr:MAG: TetR/AcrR family transcriptional regulator [Comamonadaceae bacterium]